MCSTAGTGEESVWLVRESSLDGVLVRNGKLSSSLVSESESGSESEPSCVLSVDAFLRGTLEGEACAGLAQVDAAAAEPRGAVSVRSPSSEPALKVRLGDDSDLPCIT